MICHVYAPKSHIIGIVGNTNEPESTSTGLTNVTFHDLEVDEYHDHDQCEKDQVSIITSNNTIDKCTLSMLIIVIPMIKKLNLKIIFIGIIMTVMN